MSALLMLIMLAVITWVVVNRASNRGSSTAMSEPPNQLPPLMKLPAESRSAFIVCAFSMLGKLAEADGRVTSDEEEKVKQYISNKLFLDRKTAQLALKVFRESAESPLELRDYAEKFSSSYPDRVQLLDAMVEILVELSLADGRLSAREDELIRSAAILLGLTEAGYQRIKDKFLEPEHLTH